MFSQQGLSLPGFKENVQNVLPTIKDKLVGSWMWTVGSLQSMRKPARVLQDDEQYVYLQVGKNAFDNAPRNMRTELWLSALQRKGVGVAAAGKYDELLAQEISLESATDIEKDVARTFPSTKRFNSEQGQSSLRNVLRAYAAYDPEIGYCQGMNFLSGLLLMFLPTEAQAFGALVVIMQERGLQKFYSVDMSLLQVQLWQLGRLISHKLAMHMESCGVLPVLYGASWLMTCFSADFPTSFSSRILDVMLAGCCDAALLKVAVTLLKRCEKRVRLMSDLEDILSFLKLEVPNWEESVLQDVLTEAFSQPWSTRQLGILCSLEGVETVSEAMERVRRNNEAREPEGGSAALSASRRTSQDEQRHSRSSLDWNTRHSLDGEGLDVLSPALSATPECGSPKACPAAVPVALPLGASPSRRMPPSSSAYSAGTLVANLCISNADEAEHALASSAHSHANSLVGALRGLDVQGWDPFSRRGSREVLTGTDAPGGVSAARTLSSSLRAHGLLVDLGVAQEEEEEWSEFLEAAVAVAAAAGAPVKHRRTVSGPTGIRAGASVSPRHKRSNSEAQAQALPPAGARWQAGSGKCGADGLPLGPGALAGRSVASSSLRAHAVSVVSTPGASVSASLATSSASTPCHVVGRHVRFPSSDLGALGHAALHAGPTSGDGSELGFSLVSAGEVPVGLAALRQSPWGAGRLAPGPPSAALGPIGASVSRHQPSCGKHASSGWPEGLQQAAASQGQYEVEAGAGLGANAELGEAWMEGGGPSWVQAAREPIGGLALRTGSCAARIGGHEAGVADLHDLFHASLAVIGQLQSAQQEAGPSTAIVSDFFEVAAKPSNSIVVSSTGDPFIAAPHDTLRGAAGADDAAPAVALQHVFSQGSMPSSAAPSQDGATAGSEALDGVAAAMMAQDPFAACGFVAVNRVHAGVGAAQPGGVDPLPPSVTLHDLLAPYFMVQEVTHAIAPAQDSVQGASVLDPFHASVVLETPAVSGGVAAVTEHVDPLEAVLAGASPCDTYTLLPDPLSPYLGDTVPCSPLSPRAAPSPLPSLSPISACSTPLSPDPFSGLLTTASLLPATSSVPMLAPMCTSDSGVPNLCASRPLFGRPSDCGTPPSAVSPPPPLAPRAEDQPFSSGATPGSVGILSSLSRRGSCGLVGAGASRASSNGGAPASIGEDEAVGSGDGASPSLDTVILHHLQSFDLGATRSSGDLVVAVNAERAIWNGGPVVQPLLASHVSGSIAPGGVVGDAVSAMPLPADTMSDAEACRQLDALLQPALAAT